MDSNLVFPVLMGAFVLLMIGRRVMRNIGRQPLRPVAMHFRIGLLAVIGVMFALRGLRAPELLGALVAGVVAGAALGWYGLRLTKFERTEQGFFYTPHTWIGVAVSVLLIARLAYRFFIVMPQMQAAAQADQDAFAAFQRSPLTLGIFGLLIGYYICYYAGVLRTARNAPAAREAS